MPTGAVPGWRFEHFERQPETQRHLVALHGSLELSVQTKIKLSSIQTILFFTSP